jgi:hypothetical protein
MDDQPELRVRRVPFHDTGLGREAGYADDQELIAAADKQREEIRGLLSPEAWARIEAI